MTIRVRALSSDEAEELARMARSRTLGAGVVPRVQIVQHGAREGMSAPGVAARMGLGGATVSLRLQRFNVCGLGGMEGGMRSGRPPN